MNPELESNSANTAETESDMSAVERALQIIRDSNLGYSEIAVKSLRTDHPDPSLAAKVSLLSQRVDTQTEYTSPLQGFRKNTSMPWMSTLVILGRWSPEVTAHLPEFEKMYIQELRSAQEDASINIDPAVSLAPEIKLMVKLWKQSHPGFNQVSIVPVQERKIEGGEKEVAVIASTRDGQTVVARHSIGENIDDSQTSQEAGYVLGAVEAALFDIGTSQTKEN